MRVGLSERSSIWATAALVGPGPRCFWWRWERCLGVLLEGHGSGWWWYACESVVCLLYWYDETGVMNGGGEMK